MSLSQSFLHPLHAAEHRAAFNCDDVFGPLSHCYLDFTLLFEQSVLSSVPSLILILAAPWRIHFLRKEDEKTERNRLKISKCILHGVSFLLHLILLVLWALSPSLRTKATIPSTILNLLTAATIVPLSALENDRSVRPSSLINIFLLFSGLLDVTQARTLWIRRNEFAITETFVAIVVLKFVLLILETWSKTRFLKPQYHVLSQEATSGIISRSLLWWLNGLIAKGSKRLINFDDLDDLDSKLAAGAVGDKLRKAWNERSLPAGKFALAFATWRAYRVQFFYAIFPRLCLIGLIFTQPFLITRILSLLEKPDNDRTRSEGYGLMIATGLVYIGIAVSMLHSSYSLFRFTTMYRGGMISLIYEHSLHLKEGSIHESAAVSLMSNDVDNISTCLKEMNEVWSRALEITLGVPLLTRQLGWVSVVPLIVVIGPFYGAGVLAKLISNRQKLWGDATQKRLAVTGSMLREMGSLKMMGLNDVVGQTVQNERVMETQVRARWGWIKVWQNVIMNIPSVMAPAATFGIYAIQVYLQGGDSLNTVQAFTSLALISLVSNPAARLLAAIPNTAASIGSFDRIQKFLLIETRTEQRLIPRSSPNSCAGNGYTDETITDFEDPAAMVQISKANFRPAAGAELILFGVNLQIRTGTTMITGPVGSGKTTLLKAILGEVPADSGSVYVKSARIAYCAQTPWLQSGTVRKAICGVVEEDLIDYAFYQTVVDACALAYDLSSFPKGDNTLIGSRGITLSGGQRHRVALARAIYSRCDILILDDILSALDKKTEKMIMGRLFGSKGLFQKLGSTVIMVTHATQYLSFAHQVITIPGLCQEIQQGAYREIEESELLVDLCDDEVSSQESMDNAKDLEANTGPQVKESNEVQDLRRQTGDVTIYKYYLKFVGFFPIVVFVFFVLVQVFSSNFAKLWLKWFTDSDGTHVILFISVYFLLGMGFAGGIGGYAWACAVWIGGSTGRRLHRVLLDTVLRAPSSFFSQTETGSILSRFSQDMAMIENQLSTGLLITVSNLCGAVGAAALLATGSPLVSLTAPLFIAFVYFLQRIYLRTSRQLRFLDLETRGPVYSHFLETLEGVPTIRAFGWEREFTETSERLLDDSQKPFYLMFCVQRWLALVMDLMSAAMAVLVVGLAIGFRQWTDAGLLGVSLNSLLTFNWSLAQFINGWTMLETSLGAISRLRNFERDTPVEAKPDEVGNIPYDWPSQGSVEVKHLTVYHNPSAPALKFINLAILPGQKVGICGRTGSGKSTLLSSILRTVDIASGSISIDGLDLSTLPRTIIRQHLTVVPQSPLHLPGTLRHNLDPLSLHTDDQIISALQKVHLWDVLEERSISLSTDLIPDSLSKGQGQLLALGRAILQRHKVVLLDEATSSVDQETDRVVKEVVRKEFNESTVLTVAHRPDTILDSDVIVVLEAGEVVEVGEPKELMGKVSRLRSLIGTDLL